MTPTLATVLGVAVVAQLGGLSSTFNSLAGQAQAALDEITVPLGLICVTWILLSNMAKSAVGRADMRDLGDIKIPLAALFLLGLANVLVDTAFNAGNGAG